MRSLRIDAVACGGLAAAVLLLYRKIVALWWMYDDAYLIHIAVVRRWTEYFANRDVWQSMPQHLFTPLLTASYDVELSLFGLNARAWYALQLVEVAAVSIAIYAALRLWLTRPYAFGGALLFLFGVPLCNLATELMLMHYMESLGLAVLSLVTFVLAARTARPALFVASAALYLAAMLAKEVAVPLPLLLAVLPGRRWRGLIPHAIALAIYTIWRWAMLGTLFGGYGWAVNNPWTLIGSLPLKVAASFGAAALIMSIGVLLALRSRRGATLVFIGFLIAVAPIIPVSSHFERRFALVPWLWLCASFVAGVSTLRPRLGYSLLATAALIALFANRDEWRSQYGAALRMSDEARAFFSLRSDSLLRNPAVPPAAMGELRWMKEDYERRPRGGGWFYDDLFLCQGGGSGKRVWQYENGQVTQITRRIPSIARRYCGAVRPNAPLATEFHHRGDTLHWRFGPYGDGSWRVVFGDGMQAFDVPAADAFRLGDVRSIALRVRYASPQRWVTYSPEIKLDFVNRPDFSWRR